MKSKKKPNIITTCFYILLLALISSFIFINYFKNKLGPSLIECAENEVQRITTLVMNNCIHKYIELNKAQADILKITRNNHNEIELISYNTKKVNEMTTTITKMLEDDLNYMTKGDFDKININLNNISDAYYSKINDGIIFSVSFGSATGNSLLANIGPKIPLNLKIAEDTIANINTKVTEYGINNAMIEVFIKLEATTVIHMPFMSKKVKVENSIPITMEIIQGKIPSYYLGSNLTTE